MTQLADNDESALAAQVKEQEQRQKLYDDYRNEIDRRHQSNAENFDKAILAYSSAGLGFSLGLLKDVIRVADASSMWIVKASWCLFAFAILLVVVSYPVSQKILSIQLDRADQYYKQQKDTAFDSRSWWEFGFDWVTVGSGFAFCMAMVFTTAFVFLNVGGLKK
jgi:hypothetical protein